MFTLLKGLFTTATGGWIKYVAILAVALGALFGAYEYGSSKGYKSGYTDAWNTQQLAINKMVDAQNAEVTAQNNKIATLEQAAADASSALKAEQQKKESQRNNIVTQYKAANPKVSQSPAWSPETVDTINKMIGVQQ